MTERQQQFRKILHLLVINQHTGWEVMYERALEGDGRALFELAHFVSEKLEEEALWLLKEAVEAGNDAAYYELGNYYYERAATAEDLAQVFSYYELAAMSGVADAMNNLADMYLNGEGVNVNEREAYRWFTAAAELGVAEAKFTLGIMHEQGISTEMNEHEAFLFYEQSAQAGYEEAQYRMGMIYFEGLLQTQQNEDEAFKWFMQAAQYYQLDAVFNVAYCYEHGYGVEQDIAKALLYYKQASLLGDGEARWRLADLYEGIDTEQAQKWRHLAQQQEDV